MFIGSYLEMKQEIRLATRANRLLKLYLFRNHEQ